MWSVREVGVVFGSLPGHVKQERGEILHTLHCKEKDDIRSYTVIIRDCIAHLGAVSSRT